MVAEVVEVGQLDAGLVEEDAFEHGVVLGLLLFQSVVYVDPSHFGVAVDFGAGSLFGVLVWR